MNKDFQGRIEVSNTNEYLLVANEGEVVLFYLTNFEPAINLLSAGRFAYWVGDKVLFQPRPGVLALYDIEHKTSLELIKLDSNEYFESYGGCEFVYFNNWLSIITNKGLNVYKLEGKLAFLGNIPFEFTFPFLYGYSPNGNQLIINESNSALEIFDLKNLNHRVIKSNDDWSNFGACTIDLSRNLIITEYGGASFSWSFVKYSLDNCQLISEHDKYYTRESYNIVLTNNGELLIPIQEVDESGEWKYSLSLIDLESEKIVHQFFFEKACNMGAINIISDNCIIALDESFNLYYWEEPKQTHKMKKFIGEYFVDTIE